MTDSNGNNDDGLAGLSEDSQKVVKASEDITKRLMSAYFIDGKGVHAETILAAAAYLFGEWCLRATGQPLPEKGWVVAPEVNAVMIEGSEPLLSLVERCGRRLGLEDKDIPDPVEVVARTVAAFGKSYPPLTVPRENFPLEWSPFVGPKFRGDIKQIAETYQLDGQGIATACALAVTSLQVLTRDALDPAIAIKLAYEVAIAAARMAPLSPEDARKLSEGAV